MRVALFREFFRRWFILTLCLVLTACGGSGGDSGSDAPSGDRPVVPPPITTPPITTPVVPPVGDTPVELGLMVAFGYNSLAAGAPLRTHLVQNLAVGNGTANYRFPRSGESISGNLTIAVDVADPDGIARVLVGFSGSEQALVLCDSNCGTSFSQTVTGVNPRNFGLTPGSLRLELWLEDVLGNSILFDARDIEWLPEAITGLNTSRTDTTVQINWAANSNARRYNLYIAEQPGITPENILTKTGGRQFLALSQPEVAVPGLLANQRYFVVVTGVDSSGESLFSQQHVVQPMGSAEFSAPVASPDQFSLDEDTEFRGFLLNNDSHPDDRSFNLDPQAVRLPDNGTLVLNSDGSFIYQPAANFFGNDSFIYQITDAQGLTAQALVSLTVLPVNDAPLVQDDSYSLNKNNSLNIAAPGVLNNDSDLDGDTLVVEVIPFTAPAHGSVQLNADGSFSYTPQTNYAGEDFFVYQVTDGQGGSAQARVSLRIEMTNAAPVALNDSYQVNEDARLVVDVANGILANDSDPDGDAVTLVTELPTTVKNGQLVLASDGSFLYIPNQDFFGTDSFSYQIKDPAGLVSTATVQLTVLAQNDPPVVQPSAYSANQGALLSVSAPGLLAHAFDADDNNLSLVITPVAAPAKGVLTLSANGAFSYQPNAAAAGTDSFSYQVTDPAGAVGTGTVTITIIAAPNPPVFTDLTVDLWDDVPQGFALAQFVVTNPDPDTSISFSLIAGNTQGIFNLTTAGVLSIVNPAPLVQLAGTSVPLTVKAQNSAGLSAQATVTVKVKSTQVIAKNDNYSVAEDQALTSVVSVLANDVDPKGVGLTASLVTAPAHGVLSLNSNGHFSYSPNLNFYGQDSFVYSASNGTRSAQATVLITVTPVNDTPVLHPATFTFSEAVAQGTVVGQLMWQDAEPDQSYSFSILSGDTTQAFSVTTQGQLVVASASALQARGGAGGVLTLQITDSAGVSGTALITLNLISAMPVANADAYTVDHNSLLQVNAAAGVLSNDTDPTGLGLTATAVTSGPFYGQLSLNADGSFSYQPNTDFYGQDVFSYQITNGVRTASTAVTITVVPPALLANFDAYSLDEDTLLTVTAANSLLQNDIFDPDQPLSVSLVQAPAYGTLSLNADGTFTYQPAANSYGAFDFTYRLTQGALTSDTQVELNVTSVIDAPVLQDATASIVDDYVNMQHVVTLSLFDPDPGSYSYEILSGNTGGVFALTTDGSIQVANASLLDASTTPSYSLQVKVTKDTNDSLSDTATVVIYVTAAVQKETSVLTDNAFAGGGALSVKMMLSGEYNDPEQIIPLSDGRSLVLGTISSYYTEEIFVARLKADGGVDSSYAHEGIFRSKIFSSSTSEQLVEAVLTVDNELVILVNYSESGSTGFYLLKLDAEGALDDDFGDSLGYIICEAAECSNTAVASDVLLNHSGHYVVSGTKEGATPFLFEFADSGYQTGWSATLSSVATFDLVRQDSQNNYYGIGQSDTNHIVVVRFSSAYILDAASFGCSSGNPSDCIGYQIYDFSAINSMAYDAVLYNDELYLTGALTNSSAPTSSDALFFKLTTNGSLDPAFGNNAGYYQITGSEGAPLHYRSITADHSDFYILTSTSTTEDGRNMLSVSRYGLDGLFYQDHLLSAEGHFSAVDVQVSDTAVWVLNQLTDPRHDSGNTVSFNWVAKLQPNTLVADTSFSHYGQRWFNAGFSYDSLMGIQKLASGSQGDKTLFYGYSYSYVNGSYQQAFVGRLTASGALDPSFGNHGLVLFVSEQLSYSYIQTVAESSTGQLYLAGSGYNEDDELIGFIFKLNQDGSVDQSFAGGVFELSPSAVGSYAQTAVAQLQPGLDGSLLVGAEFSQDYYNSDIVLLQLKPDGSLNTGEFGPTSAGYVVFDAIDPDSETSEHLSGLILDPVDDSIVISGQHYKENDPQLYLARFSASGLPMNSVNYPSEPFGDSGQGFSLINLVDNIDDSGNYSEHFHGLDFDAGRNLVLAMSRNNDGDHDYYLYRLQGNGLVDTSFNSGVPRLFNSFSDMAELDLQIRDIRVDPAGRLLMVGTYYDVSDLKTWVGRVLLDGSGTEPGRWDPAFASDSSNYGAYVMPGVSSYAYDVFMELTSSKVTLGWSDYESSEYVVLFRQYQLYEYDANIAE